MHRHANWVHLVFYSCLLLTTSSSSVGAQPREPEGYRAILDQALSEYDDDHFSEAYANFQRAHKMYPNSRTHRGLGITAFRGRRYVEAIEQLRAALEHPLKPLTAEQRAGVEELLATAENNIAHLEVMLSPESANLVVDGKRTLNVEKVKTLQLDPGDHELVFEAPEHTTVIRRIKVDSGERQQLTVTLKPINPSASRGVEESAPLRQPQPKAQLRVQPPIQTSSLGPYITVGAGGAILVAGLVTGLLASQAEGKLDSDCSSGGKMCPHGFEDRVNSGNTLMLATNVLLVVGGLAVAGGLTWWFVERPDEDTTPTAAFACHAGGCTARVAARF